MERLTEWTGYEWIPRQERLNGKLVGYKDCMKRLAEYENTGLTPAQIREIDKLFKEKRKELAEYKKLEERLYNMFEGTFPLSMIAEVLEFTLTEPDKPHPVYARILTYEQADKYHKWQELEKQGRLLELPVAAGEKLY